MSSTNVHSNKDQKAVYGIVYAEGNKSLVMPPKNANEAKKEKDPNYKMQFQVGGKYYTDKEETRVTKSGQVLAGSKQTANKILSEVEKKEEQR